MRDIYRLPVPHPPYEILSKPQSRQCYVNSVLNRTQIMFDYKNLPETIPRRILELFLQTYGNVCFAKYEDKLFVYTGGFGGEPDEYYRPTIYTVSNPYQNFSKDFKIGKDCVIMPNDSCYMGLLPMIERYSELMTEIDITTLLSCYNSRIQALITANTDVDKASADKYINDIIDGKLGAILSKDLIESIKTSPFAMNTHSEIISIIELSQYVKGSFFNDLGLQANYNMKRERLTTEEINAGNDTLTPLVEDMLDCRRMALKEVNDMFDTDIEVHLSNAWLKNYYMMKRDTLQAKVLYENALMGDNLEKYMNPPQQDEPQQDEPQQDVTMEEPQDEPQQEVALEESQDELKDEAKDE